MPETSLSSEQLYAVVSDAERTLRLFRRELDRARRPRRDLAAEIEAALAAHGPLTVPELGRVLRRRQSEVRRVLHEHPGRWGIAQDVPGRSPKAKCWDNSRGPSVIDPGTSDESMEATRA